MQYYIKEWQDDCVSLITEDGYPVEIFESIDEVIETCVYDCIIQPTQIEQYTPLVEIERDVPDLDYIY